MTRSLIDDVEETALSARTERGGVFEYGKTVSVANGGAKAKWLFVTGNNITIIHSRLITTNGNEMTYQAFKGPTVSDNGTDESSSIARRNGNQPQLSTNSVFVAPTTSADGAGLPPVYMPGADGVGNTQNGGFSSEFETRILEPNTTYMVQVTNSGSTNPAMVNWYLSWTERPVGNYP